MKNLPRRTILFLGIGMAVALAVGLRLIASSQEDSGDQLRELTTKPVLAAFSSPEQLTFSARAVVVAELQEESTAENAVPSRTAEPPSFFRTDIHRTFAVSEVLKGDVREGGAITVWHTSRIEDRLSMTSQMFDVPEVQKGKQYLLFLGRASDGHQDYWIVTGEPQLAEIRGQELLFFSSSAYQEAAGLQPGTHAPFTATLDQIRALARENRQPPAESTFVPVGTQVPGQSSP